MKIEQMFVKLIKAFDRSYSKIKVKFIPEELEGETAVLFHLEDYRKGATYNYLLEHLGCKSCKAMVSLERYAISQREMHIQKRQRN